LDVNVRINEGRGIYKFTAYLPVTDTYPGAEDLSKLIWAENINTAYLSMHTSRGECELEAEEDEQKAQRECTDKEIYSDSGTCIACQLYFKPSDDKRSCVGEEKCTDT